MHPYTDDPHLNLYVFEESYVLGWEAAPTRFAFRLDVAPSTDNPRWHPPPPGDAITWWPATLVFDNCTSIDFRPSGVRPAVDANGEQDYDGIDGFELTADGFALTGIWGDLRVAGGTARVVLDDPALEA
jgi:hypothetical protein